MSANQNVSLIGRIAIQLKMITLEQLREATSEQARLGEKRLGQVLLDLGYLDTAQLERLQKVQRDVVARHRAKQAATGDRSSPGPAAEGAEPVGPAADVAAPAVPPPAPVSAAKPGPTAQARPPASPPVASTPEPTLPTQPASAAPSTPSRPAPPAPPAAPTTVAPAVEAGPSLELSLCEPGEADLERLHGLLRRAVEVGASDIHVHAEAPLGLRINGQLSEVESTPLTREESERLVAAALTPEQRETVRRHGEIDICYSAPGIGRFRTNLYRHQRGFDVVMRSIPAEPPTLEQLRLPGELAKYTNYHQGMVLVTGPAGCGKSSTLAALVNLINEERDEHILTIEDPIEVVHPSKRCLVNQRHAGSHTASFARALRGALREDPDVIVIGELRDLETISLAMTAAETGHFVLATLHTNNAVRTINRMIGAFPSNEQDQVRTMLSESLRAVISQRLVTTADGSGRLPALELLVINKAIANLVRDEKTVQIRSAIQTGKAHGMMLLEQSLNEMVRAGDITKEEALRYAEDEKLITG